MSVDVEKREFLHITSGGVTGAVTMKKFIRSSKN